MKTFYHFSKLYHCFPDFFQVWKIAGQISRLCANPASKNGHYFCVILTGDTSGNSNTSNANREKGKVKTFRTLSAVSATLKTSDVSLNLRFSVGTKPSRKMLIPVKMKIHWCSNSSIKFYSYLIKTYVWNGHLSAHRQRVDKTWVYMLWLNFIIGVICIFLFLQFSIIHYHTPKFKARIKFNHNIIQITKTFRF